MLEKLYHDRRWKEFISKQDPPELQEDLSQFVMVKLHDWVEKNNYTGDLFPIAVGIARKQMWSDSSEFYKLHRRKQKAQLPVSQPDSLHADQLAVVNCILQGKPVHETLGHRHVTLPMKSLRYQADHYHSMQQGLFKRTTAVVNIPIVLTTDANDMDAVNDLMEALQAYFNKQLGKVPTPNSCICEVGELILHTIKFAEK